MKRSPKALRKLREDLGLSIDELAELSGVNRNTIWKLEAGESTARGNTIRKLLDVLEAPEPPPRDALSEAVEHVAKALEQIARSIGEKPTKKP